MRDKSELAKEAAAAAAIVFWEIQLRMNMLANGSSSGDLYHRRCNNKI